eukprot:gene4239-5221_t
MVTQPFDGNQAAATEVPPNRFAACASDTERSSLWDESKDGEADGARVELRGKAGSPSNDPGLEDDGPRSAGEEDIGTVVEDQREEDVGEGLWAEGQEANLQLAGDRETVTRDGGAGRDSGGRGEEMDDASGVADSPLAQAQRKIAAAEERARAAKLRADQALKRTQRLQEEAEMMRAVQEAEAKAAQAERQAEEAEREAEQAEEQLRQRALRIVDSIPKAESKE